MSGSWKPEQQRNRLGVIEEDIRSLMRKLAESEAAGAEKDKRNTAQHRCLLLSLLDVMDAFERVFDSIAAKKDACNPQMNIWVGNFRTIQRLFKKFLSEQGITLIENLDQGFDPHWHEVERTVLDTSKPVGFIVEEVKKGYLWQGKELLRRSKIVVVTHDASKTSDLAEDETKAGRDHSFNT